MAVMSVSSVCSEDANLSNSPSQAKNDVFNNANTLRLWLNSIGMSQYLQAFIDEGFGDEMSQTDALQCLTNGQLKEMGVNKIAHRNLILTNVNKLTMNEGLGNNMMTLGDDADSDSELDHNEIQKITSGHAKEQRIDHERH